MFYNSNTLISRTGICLNPDSELSPKSDYAGIKVIDEYHPGHTIGDESLITGKASTPAYIYFS